MWVGAGVSHQRVRLNEQLERESGRDTLSDDVGGDEAGRMRGVQRATRGGLIHAR